MEDVREIARGRVLLRARNTRLEGSDSDKADAYENLEESLESMQEDVEYALERIDLSGRRIDRLKEERRRNTESVSLIRLEDQHETLLRELERKKNLISDVAGLRRQYKPIHAIALRCILETAVPPSDFLDPSLTAGLHPYWSRVLRMKKSWVLVCKDWNFVAVPILYDDIVLRHVGQLPALASSIRSNPGLGGLVHSLTFAFTTPRAFNSVVTSCTQFILQTCPNIRKLYFSSEFLVGCPVGLPLFTLPDAGEMATCIQHTASQLTVLGIHYDEIFHDPKPRFPTSILYASQNLVTLYIRIPECRITLSKLDLKNLENLFFMHNTFDHKDCRCLGEVGRWNLPKLDSLTLLCQWKEESQEKDIFHSLGKRLRYLDIAHAYPAPRVHTQDYVIAILELCPVLQHLIYPSNVAWDDLTNFLSNPLSRSLSFLDFISMASRFLSQILIFGTKRPPRCRRIDTSLDRIPGLARLIPPDPLGLPPATSRIHRIFDLTILETRWALTEYKGDISESLNPFLRDMTPRSGTPQSDISSSDFSMSDTYYSDEDESENDNEEQITEEEAIEIFRSTL